MDKSISDTNSSDASVKDEAKENINKVNEKENNSEVILSAIDDMKSIFKEREGKKEENIVMKGLNEKTHNQDCLEQNILINEGIKKTWIITDCKREEVANQIGKIHTEKEMTKIE